MSLYSEINDNNVSQVFFKDLKVDKEITLIMYGDIYQYQTEFYINGYFIDSDEEFHMAYLPLKTLAAFPLGARFKNRQLTGEHALSKYSDIKIFLNKKSTGFNKISKYNDLKQKFSKIPDEIRGYSGQQNKILNQYVVYYKDQNSGNIFYIPHYEIARWFYFRSSSLTRQVLARNLDGLYYEAKYVDAKMKKAELYLKHGSNNDDAAEIFRFAVDEFAYIMFHELGIKLSSSRISPDNARYDARMRIRADFPVYGELNLKVKAFPVNEKKNAYFIYQIIEEDSRYPFEKLAVYRYGANSKKEKEAFINKKRPNKENLSKIITSDTPSSDYENVTTYKDAFLEEKRRDLDKKLITFPPLLDPDDENDSIERIFQTSGIDLDLSFTDASVGGDEDKVHTSFVQNLIQDENEHFEKRENNLLVFKKMVLMLPDIAEEKKNTFDLSVNIIRHENLPRKPKGYKGRAKWEKSKLSDGRPRQYMIAEVSIADNFFYVIEIEREDGDTSSIQAVYTKNERIPVNQLYHIVRNFVESNGKWKIPNHINSFYMKHVGNVENRARRLYQKIIMSLGK